MIYFAASIYLAIGAGFALGMTAEAVARQGHMFDSRAEILTLPLAVVAWLPVTVWGITLEYRAARRASRPFFIK